MRHGARRIGILRDVRRGVVVSSLLAVAAAIAIVAALRSSGEPEGRPAPAHAADSRPPRATDEVLGIRNRRAKVVEPVAGESAASAALPVEEEPASPRPASAASAASRPKLEGAGGPTSDAAISEADVLKNGIALPPIEAPEAVRQIIEAGNSIARAPYLWGGGHGKWLDRGYDCSGSISYALASAGLLDAPMDSGRLMRWGKPGRGKWITIYSNPGHVYMVVAGVRFDTSGRRSSGSRWQAQMRTSGSFVARHPPGL